MRNLPHERPPKGKLPGESGAWECSSTRSALWGPLHTREAPPASPLPVACRAHCQSPVALQRLDFPSPSFAATPAREAKSPARFRAGARLEWPPMPRACVRYSNTGPTSGIGDRPGPRCSTACRPRYLRGARRFGGSAESFGKGCRSTGPEAEASPLPAPAGTGRPQGGPADADRRPYRSWQITSVGLSAKALSPASPARPGGRQTASGNYGPSHDEEVICPSPRPERLTLRT